MEGDRAPEIVPEPQPPALGQRERIEQRIEQRNIAEAEPKILKSGAAHGFDREHNDFDIGALPIGFAEALNARLAEFARVLPIGPKRLKAERRSVIAIAGHSIGVRVTFKIKPGHRHCQVGPEAKLLAGKISKNVSPAPDLFADPVEKDIRRLEH